MARIRKIFYKEQTAPLFKGINAIIIGLDYRYKEKENQNILISFIISGLKAKKRNILKKHLQNAFLSIYRMILILSRTLLL